MEKTFEKKLLEKLRKEIDNLEKELKNERKTKFKKNIVKNLKVSLSLLKYFTPYILVGTLSVSVVNLLTERYPLHLDNKKCYLNQKTIIDNLGNRKTYEKYDKFLESTNLNIYNKWEKIDKYIYKRKIQAYKIPNLTNMELINLLNNYKDLIKFIENLDFTEIIETCPVNKFDNKSNKKYFEVSVYSENKKSFIVKKEDLKEDVGTNLLNLLIIYILVCGINFYRSVNNYPTFSSYIESVKENVNYYDIPDVKKIKKTLELKKETYNSLVGE